MTLVLAIRFAHTTKSTRSKSNNEPVGPRQPAQLLHGQRATEQPVCDRHSDAPEKWSTPKTDKEITHLNNINSPIKKWAEEPNRHCPKKTYN